MLRSFCFFLFCVCFFLDFGFLVCFLVCSGFFSLNPYILCAAGLINIVCDFLYVKLPEVTSTVKSAPICAHQKYDKFPWISGYIMFERTYFLPNIHETITASHKFSHPPNIPKPSPFPTNQPRYKRGKWDNYSNYRSNITHLPIFTSCFRPPGSHHVPSCPIPLDLKLFKLWTIRSCRLIFSAFGARSLIQVSCRACSAVYLRSCPTGRYGRSRWWKRELQDGHSTNWWSFPY